MFRQLTTLPEASLLVIGYALCRHPASRLSTPQAVMAQTITENTTSARICAPPCPGANPIVNASAGDRRRTAQRWIRESSARRGSIEKSTAIRVTFRPMEIRRAITSLQRCPCVRIVNLGSKCNGICRELTGISFSGLPTTLKLRRASIQKRFSSSRKIQSTMSTR